MTVPGPSPVAVLGASAALPFDSVPDARSDQYDLKLQIYGRTRRADEAGIAEGGLTDRRLIALYARRGRIRAAVGGNRMRALRGYRAQVAEAAVFEVGSAA